MRYHYVHYLQGEKNYHSINIYYSPHDGSLKIFFLPEVLLLSVTMWGKGLSKRRLGTHSSFCYG